MSSLKLSLTGLLALFLLNSCATTGGGGAAYDPQRSAKIAAEPAGNYWVGRRHVMPYTHLWGYIRKPGKSWSTSQLVIIDEKYKRQPDRLPEEYSGSGRMHGYDHNHEYHLQGYFSGETGYDPNSNLILPVFVLQDYTLVDPNPGYLFTPGEKFSPTRLPRPEPQP
jgi:hypothetical protein